MRQLSEPDAGSSIEVRLGEQLEVRLPENSGSTGFRWTFASTGEPQCALVEELGSGSSHRPGAPAERVWRFAARQTGRARIALAYVRPWEQGAEPARTFAVDVHVQA